MVAGINSNSSINIEIVSQCSCASCCWNNAIYGWFYNWNRCKNILIKSVIVYLDKNEILNDEDNPPLPNKLYKQLQKRLEKFEIYDPAEINEYL